ncbi:substrate-binding periplasmic protein [Shewanella sp.]|uniref:substrate-binding periplasmic protein n=1 Tax=Shewanella sp. TaxID=50422 RepID=UPI003569E3BA
MSKKNYPTILAYWLPVLWLVTGICHATDDNKINVTVGGYSFPPYVVVNSSGYTGVVPEMVEALNELESQYNFSFVPTSVSNRYEAFSRHRFDLLFFESPEWGWENTAKSVLPLNVEDGEVFIGLKPQAAAEGYFDNLQQKRLLLVRGYHYRIVGFETDEAKLKHDFLAALVPDTQAAIEGLLLERGDVSPVSQSFLNWYLGQNPQKAERIFISSRWDQQYQHAALIHPQSRIAKEQLQLLIGQLESEGTFADILNKYYLKQR